MARHSSFNTLSLQRRRAPPAALELAHSTFDTSKPTQELSRTQFVDISSPEVIECLRRFREEESRASAELECAQAAFTASLEHDPLPGVRARSPTAYRMARMVFPMETEVQQKDVLGLGTLYDEPEETGRSSSQGEYRFPLPDGQYQFPPVAMCLPRPSIATIEPRTKQVNCISIPWLSVVRILRLKGRRRRSRGRALPEPLGFQERIQRSEHEWRPVEENKGMLPTLAHTSSLHIEWPWS